MEKRSMVVLSFVALASLSGLLNGAELPLGALTHDGPPTPEQISMHMPVTGELSRAARADVRYRLTSEKKWSSAHPLIRIRKSGAFAGVITGLVPGASYTVEVTVKHNDVKAVKTLAATTRALPPAAGKVTNTIRVGTSIKEIRRAFKAAVPGDVIQFVDGTHEVGGLYLDGVKGTPEKPIYIRGQSRKGTVLKNSVKSILSIWRAQDIVIENLTFQGAGVDSGTKAGSHGISFWSGAKPQQQRVTIRNNTFVGVDKGIIASGNPTQILVYDNTLTGNNKWTEDFICSKKTWNDDGIRIPGLANAAFNNTLTGFGDALAMAGRRKNTSVHFYRNDIRMTGDDAFEADYGVRNITFYDNRIHNAMTHVSVDPIHGGPLFVFRNIAINIGRGPYKLNASNSGHFFYNNTVVRAPKLKGGKEWGWVQFANGPQVSWGYVNNILIFHGKGRLLAMEARGQNPVDFNHNAWHPDGKVWWSKTGGSFKSLEEARSRLKPVKPVFGTCTKRHENDVICKPNPFECEVKLDEGLFKEIKTPCVPMLAKTSQLRGKGVAVPGVTDGFAGDAPDLGAVITGRSLPAWGDRTALSKELKGPSNAEVRNRSRPQTASAEAGSSKAGQ